MHKFVLAIAATVCCLFAVAPSFAVDGGRYGEVKIAVPANAPRGYVVLFSDAGGWTPQDDARLAAIGRTGALAIGVDTDAYLDRAARQDPRCLQLLGDAEGLSRQLQREHPGSEYFFPILAGVGKGGALAGAILAQAPPRTIAGGVSIDPWSAVNGPRAFCERVVTRDDVGEPGIHGVPILKNPWTVALSPDSLLPVRAHFQTLVTLVPKLDVRLLASQPTVDAMAELIEQGLVPDNFSNVAGLPLIELPAEAKTGRMAVFVSGDGGWRDIDKTIGENLQSMGVSVVGWDSLRYFWSKKTPAETASDIAAVIGAYSAKWHCDKVALIGFSFGADVLPFVYDRLQPDLRERVAMITLLSPSRAADWQIRVVGWLGAGPSVDAKALAPELRAIPGQTIQCFYGDQDRNSYCAELTRSGAEVFEKKGLHHFDGDYVLIARQILDGLNRRVSSGK